MKKINTTGQEPTHLSAVWDDGRAPQRSVLKYVSSEAQISAQNVPSERVLNAYIG